MNGHVNALKTWDFCLATADRCEQRWRLSEMVCVCVCVCVRSIGPFGDPRVRSRKNDSQQHAAARFALLRSGTMRVPFELFIGAQCSTASYCVHTYVLFASGIAVNRANSVPQSSRGTFRMHFFPTTFGRDARFHQCWRCPLDAFIIGQISGLDCPAKCRECR